MKEINDKLMEEEVCQSESTHTEAHKSLNEELSRLMTEVKGGIWQRKVIEAKGTSEMWRVLKSLTYNNNNSIITANGRACVSQRQKVNAVMNKSVSS